MIFLGLAFYGGTDSVFITPTGSGMPYNRVEITAAQYDDIYVTTNPEIDKKNLSGQWDASTELYGKFDININAGNIDYTTRTIDTILIKRRKAGTFKWTTIASKKAETVNDLRVSGYDYTAASKQEYEYAAVPVYGETENIYYIDTVYSDFDGLFIAEKDVMYGTPVGTQCDVTRNAPSSVAELLNNKYPKYISNTIANYDTGNASGQFIETTCTEVGCVDTYKSLWDTRNKILAFLTNKKPKILKYETGAIWLINVTGAPTDNGAEQGLSDLRTISFEWTETGDCNDEPSLYYAGLIDTPSKWWN